MYYLVIVSGLSGDVLLTRNCMLSMVRTHKRTTWRQRYWRRWTAWKSKFPAEIKEMPTSYFDKWVTWLNAAIQVLSQ